MMRNLLAFILCAVLTGCATSSQRGQVIMGEEVIAPGGFYMLCAEQPGPECGNLNAPAKPEPVEPRSQHVPYYQLSTYCTTGVPVICYSHPVHGVVDSK